MAGSFEKAFLDLARFAESATLAGPIKAAEDIVDELQKNGPSWTGRFSNSWQIEGPQGQSVKGDGNPGEARPLRFKGGPFTGPQALSTLIRTGITTDKVVFTISNNSEYFAEAVDGIEQPNALYKEGWEITNGKGPQTRLGKSNFDQKDTGRSGDQSKRGDIGGGNPTTTSSRTAPQDWFADYARGGKLDKAVRIALDEKLRNVFR